MFDQETVTQWLDNFVRNLQEMFCDRLVFVAHHGSWARGEARPDSDIDTFVILDRIHEADLTAFRDLMNDLCNGQHVVSSFFGSVAELKAWPRHEQIECWHGARVLHGDLASLVEPPTDDDFIEDVRIKAAMNLHVARHYLLHPHDLKAVIFRLHYPFKECFYAMQSWLLLTTGTYYARKIDMLANVSDPDDEQVIRVSKDWHELANDREQRPLHYIQLLERWARNMLPRLVEWQHGAEIG